MKKKLLSVFAAVLTAACSGTGSSVEGVYVGTLPAADCPGIETELVLRSSGQCELTSEYVGRDARFTNSGCYCVEDGVVTVRFDEGEPVEMKYRVEEGALRMLDADGRAVEGELADCYLLKKVNGND